MHRAWRDKNRKQDRRKGLKARGRRSVERLKKKRANNLNEKIYSDTDEHGFYGFLKKYYLCQSV